jgi:hypothetical protein
MSNKLTMAAHITRKSGPYVGMVTMFLVAVHDLKQNRKS